jgi:hypothetical protein
MFNVTPAHSYRATYIPKDVPADEAELKASQGVLPFVQFKATNSGKAAAIARALTGLHVLSVDRVEVPA